LPCIQKDQKATASSAISQRHTVWLYKFQTASEAKAISKKTLK